MMDVMNHMMGQFGQPMQGFGQQMQGMMNGMQGYGGMQGMGMYGYGQPMQAHQPMWGGGGMMQGGMQAHQPMQGYGQQIQPLGAPQGMYNPNAGQMQQRQGMQQPQMQARGAYDPNAGMANAGGTGAGRDGYGYRQTRRQAKRAGQDVGQLPAHTSCRVLAPGFTPGQAMPQNGMAPQAGMAPQGSAPNYASWGQFAPTPEQLAMRQQSYNTGY